MPKQYERRPNEVIDGWKLKSPLGYGGNAEVWEARNDDGQKAALKILRQKRPEAEPYKRFISEIDALKRIGCIPGVLPLIGHSLPDNPTKEKPAWLLTTLANPIRSALGTQPDLEMVVKSIADISTTLTSLVFEHGIYHRDIKPENLYRLDDSWCLGDFGLVTFPNKADLTAPGKHIGPFFYLAPELLNNPKSNPGPADVYSLAKTLWVLATSQNYPLPGHIFPQFEPFRIGSYFPHARVRPIELLIGRATHSDPDQRPSMKDMSEELQAWLRPNEVRSPEVELGLIGARARDVIGRNLNSTKKILDRKEHVLATLAKVKPQLEKIGAHAFSATGLSSKYDAWSRFSDWDPIKNLNHLPDLSYGRHIAMHLQAPLGTDKNPAQIDFFSGIGLGAMKDESIVIIAAHIISVDHKTIHCTWTDSRKAPLGSAIEENAVQELCNGLLESFPKALTSLIEILDK